MATEIGSDAYKISKFFIFFTLYLILVSYLPFSYASDWQFTPSVTLSESYSDNINLAPKGEEKGVFVTELSPGISIRNKSSRNKLNLDYRMQNLHNSGGNNKLDVFHQLQFNLNSEVLRNSLFIDMNSSVDQQNVTNLNAANDNVSGSDNRTTVSTYEVSPYWTPHLNGYADGEVRFSYNKFITDGGGASDSEEFDYSVRLNSGRRFSHFTWFVDYNKRDQIRDDGDNVKFQEGTFELRHHFNRHFNIFTQVGFSENDFRATINQNNNGFFYRFGAKWKPGERVSVEAAIGNNSFVTLDVMLTRHMHWITTYHNNNIGTNTGSVWETKFDYETKRAHWSASYQEDTSTIQTELSNNQAFTIIDEFGNPVFDPVTQQPVQSDISLPTLVDEVILTKKGDISFSYKTGKSKVIARVFSNRTIFQVSKTKNDVLGINGSWDWSISRRSTFFIRPAWQQTKRDDSTDYRSDIALGFNRRIPITIGRRAMLNAKIEYRYVNQTSDIKTNEFTENRITANLLLTY